MIIRILNHVIDTDYIRSVENNAVKQSVIITFAQGEPLTILLGPNTLAEHKGITSIPNADFEQLVLDSITIREELLDFIFKAMQNLNGKYTNNLFQLE